MYTCYIEQHLSSAPLTPVASVPLSTMTASRARDCIEQQQYQDLMQAHIPRWTKDYTSANPDHFASHYESFLSAIILQTSRVNVVPVKVAAMHKFRVKYSEAHQFATAVATFVSSLRRKAASVTSGKRQSPATLRLVTSYRLKYGEEKLEDDEQESEVPKAASPKEKDTRPANPVSSSAAPSWDAFLKRFDKVVRICERASFCLQPAHAHLYRIHTHA